MKKITFLAIAISLLIMLSSSKVLTKNNNGSMSKLCVIKKVELTKMPSLNPNGKPWDLGSGPDVYFTIFCQGKEIYKSGVKYDLDVSTLPVYYYTGLPFTLPYLNQQYTISFYEFENNTLLKKDRYIDGRYFNPKEYVNKTQVSFGAQSDFSFKLYLAWE